MYTWTIVYRFTNYLKKYFGISKTSNSRQYKILHTGALVSNLVSNNRRSCNVAKNHPSSKSLHSIMNGNSERPFNRGNSIDRTEHSFSSELKFAVVAKNHTRSALTDLENGQSSLATSGCRSIRLNSHPYL